MPSILPGYEYDIFISYRQNDNQDGWVTEFVESLKREIKATFKEQINIYFDQNPYDGLAETHDVDDSLAKKLKCLTFIPIISKTYCDPNSFAWNNEFLEFKKLAEDDDYGLKVNLPNGNTASRILPIRIHDIDNEDKQLIEKEIGFLRSIDFVYKEPGVNRPLRPNDNEDKNLNSTNFRNQVNKVANSIQEIIKGIKGDSRSSSEEQALSPSNNTEPGSAKPITKSKKGLLTGVIAVLLIAAVSYFILSKDSDTRTKEVGRSIAVLAFADQSPNGDQGWLGDGIADEIMNVLAKAEGLKVSGRTSSFSFKGKDVTIKEIGDQLDVKTVLEGSVSKLGNQIRITAQLIDVETEAHIWSNKYDRNSDDIFAIVDEVSQSIVGSLMSELSSEDIKALKMAYQPNAEAYEYFLKANQLHDEYMMNRYPNNIFLASKDFYQKALSVDPQYADAMAGLADLYDTRGNVRELEEESNRIRDSILNVAYAIDNESPYVLYLKGHVTTTNLDSAFYFYKKAYDIDPKNIGVTLLTFRLTQLGLDDVSLKVSKDLLSSDPLNSDAQRRVIFNLGNLGQFEELARQAEKYISVYDTSNTVLNRLFIAKLLVEKDTIEAERLNRKMNLIMEGDNYRKALILAVKGKASEALAISQSPWVKAVLGMNEEVIPIIEERMKDKNPFRGNFDYFSLMHSPFFENVRNEPQFQQWIKEAKVVYDENMRKYGSLFME